MPCGVQNFLASGYASQCDPLSNGPLAPSASHDAAIRLCTMHDGHHFLGDADRPLVYLASLREYRLFKESNSSFVFLFDIL